MTEETHQTQGTETTKVETTPPQIRRGPGRPPKSENGATTVPPTAGEPPKKRGRPKGGTKKVEPIDSDALAKQIVGIHMVAAQITGIPEIAISDVEGAMLAASVALMCDEYDLNLNGKTGAFVQLLASAAFIYIPRVPVIRARIAQQKLGANFNGAQSDAP